MTDIKFKIDKAVLAKIEAFIASKPTVKIGILSNQWQTPPDDENERKIGPVELGMVHEFGSKSRNIPARSFLRKTAVLRANDFQAEITANREKIFQSIAEGRGQEVLEKVGATWVGYVLDAFDSGGPGWRPLKRATVRRRRLVATGKILKSGKAEMKRSRKILWVTGALARSIHYEVSKP